MRKRGMRPYHWRASEEQFLIENYDGMTVTMLQRQIKRPMWAIYAKARALGLRKRSQPDPVIDPPCVQFAQPEMRRMAMGRR